MKINYKKSLKFVTLLITSLLIATVSAQVYRYMYIYGTITVGSPKLIWLEGEGVTAVIVGGSATVSLNVENDTAMNFTRALYLKNTNDTITFNYNITVLTTLESNNFQVAKIHIYDNSSGELRDTIDLTNSTDFSYGTLAPNACLRFTIEVKAIKNDISRNFVVQVEYWQP